MRAARFGVGAQRQADDPHPAQPGHAAPEIQTNAGGHDRIGAGRVPIRRREHDLVSGL